MYNTALTLTDTLSRVITSCGGMSIATMRRDTRRWPAKRAGRNTSPGPFVPQYRPRKNATPRSYWRITRRLAKRYATVMASPAVSSSTATSSGEGFDNNRDALTTADAGGAKSVAAAALSKCMEQMRGDAGAACGERMTDSDGAAIHVGPVARESELALYGEVLR